MQALRTYRLALVYLAFSELVYVLYEWQLPGGPHSGNALALGLVLAALSLPMGLAAGSLQWHAGILLGYTPGDTHAFWPRLVAWQAALLVNFLILAVMTKNRPPKDGQRPGNAVAEARKDA